jgi:hypothetical protein
MHTTIFSPYLSSVNCRIHLQVNDLAHFSESDREEFPTGLSLYFRGFFPHLYRNGTWDEGVPSSIIHESEAIRGRLFRFGVLHVIFDDAVIPQAARSGERKMPLMHSFLRERIGLRPQ